MGFGIGNLITIGIVLLLLILFRLIDRNLRSVNKVRKYIDQCKGEIASFVEEKVTYIKNFGTHFDVERKSAAELLRRIQSITREELAQKVQALTVIDERIREYDTNLEELLQMTGKVQENLNRLRDESAFVENIEKKLKDFREKFEPAEAQIDSIGEKLASIEAEFEQENNAALERAVEDALSAVNSKIMDMESEAQNISRKVEEHREAVDRLERGRLERLARDEQRIDKLLSEAIERAGSRADKIEDAALAKLRDQAQERVNHIKAGFEEKIKNVQETVKTKTAEINEELKNSRKEIQELETFAKQVKDEWAADSHKTGQEIIAATERRLEEYRQVQEEQYKQLASIANDTTRLEEELRRSMRETINRVNGDFARFGDEMRDSWEGVSGEYTDHLQALRKDLAGVDQELLGIKEKSFENVSKKLKGFEDDFLANLSKRSGEIDRQLGEWQQSLDKRLCE
ncbi:MAG: hypothetical protein LBU85_03990, partial [Treponema sp.]|nr:hypothetical protein [Treponema sp.]